MSMASQAIYMLITNPEAHQTQTKRIFLKDEDTWSLKIYISNNTETLASKSCALIWSFFFYIYLLPITHINCLASIKSK